MTAGSYRHGWITGSLRRENVAMGKILRTGANSELKSAEMQIVVTRADGTVEDLGTQAYWHKNPLKRLLYRLTGRTR